MRASIDTHTLLWAVDQPTQLGASATAVLLDPANDLLLSAASVSEIAIKVALKKLGLSLPYNLRITKAIGSLGLAVLPITPEYADAQIGLPLHHRDPFDRLLVAQAIVERVPVVTIDVVFDRYGVNRIRS